MIYTFYSEVEYRKFVRKLQSLEISFSTKSKPFEMPIILVVENSKILY